MAKIFRMSEVSEHNSKKSAWFVIHDKVYDITKFMDEHPGGEEVLLEQSGKNATEPFEDVGHSSDARDLMKDLLVGELHEEDRSKTPKQKENIAVVSSVYLKDREIRKEWLERGTQVLKEKHWGTEKSDPEESGGNWRSWVIPLAFGLAATVLYRYYLHYSSSLSKP